MGYKVSWDGETKTVTVSHDAELISYYKNTFVPDYGALYGVEGIETDNGVYILRACRTFPRPTRIS